MGLFGAAEMAWPRTHSFAAFFCNCKTIPANVKTSLIILELQYGRVSTMFRVRDARRLPFFFLSAYGRLSRSAHARAMPLDITANMGDLTDCPGSINEGKIMSLRPLQ